MMRPEKNTIGGKHFQKKKAKRPVTRLPAPLIGLGRALQPQIPWPLGTWDSGVQAALAGSQGHSHVDARDPGAHPGSQVTARGLSASPEISPTASAQARMNGSFSYRPVRQTPAPCDVSAHITLCSRHPTSCCPQRSLKSAVTLTSKTQCIVYTCHLQSGSGNTPLKWAESVRMCVHTQVDISVHIFMSIDVHMHVCQSAVV